MLDWTNQGLAKIFIAISEPANCRIDCSQPLFFFNANAENSERERKRAVGARLLSLLRWCYLVNLQRQLATPIRNACYLHEFADMLHF